MSVAGCTSSSNINPLAADNLAGAINDRYKALDYTVTTPFTMTKEKNYTVKRTGDNTTYSITGDVIAYHGVVSQGNNASLMNVTIVLTTNSSMDNIYGRATLFSKTCSELHDSTKSPYAMDELGSTVGKDAGTYCKGPSYRVDSIQPTHRDELWLAGTDLGKFEYLYNADVGNYYEQLAVANL